MHTWKRLAASSAPEFNGRQEISKRQRELVTSGIPQKFWACFTLNFVIFQEYQEVACSSSFREGWP